ncbi:uncharacterized protein BP5553_03601 [Venustampulla echinocandica]|uniref:BHLH domain-containing protein n=1 Tax=Venustampulla echinocandica TaxID=2656787 RepID=A0A370TUQ8_9HELO|nr:uncharacterized protein BP5553_03601 [Venustampulla echinocandica]RDL39261.1 hypothetical protein BP5553_03601 [Venustampulla echinocandica]
MGVQRELGGKLKIFTEAIRRRWLRKGSTPDFETRKFGRYLDGPRHFETGPSRTEVSTGGTASNVLDYEPESSVLYGIFRDNRPRPPYNSETMGYGVGVQYRGLRRNVNGRRFECCTSRITVEDAGVKHWTLRRDAADSKHSRKTRSKHQVETARLLCYVVVQVPSPKSKSADIPIPIPIPILIPICTRTSLPYRPSLTSALQPVAGHGEFWNPNHPSDGKDLTFTSIPDQAQQNHRDHYVLSTLPPVAVAQCDGPMLAVQRPSMGSSKPPNFNMPFGYSFNESNSNFPLPSQTPPAPGPSLLDDNESKFLDSFFDDVSQDQFDFNFFTNAPGRADAGFGWEELPPTFMGTTSSFGQQPAMGAHNFLDPNFDALSLQMPTGPSLPQPTPDDVIEAATLLQNGSAGRPRGAAQGTFFPPQDMSIPPSNGLIRPQYTQQRSFPGAHERSSSRNEFTPDTYYADMVFGRNPDKNPPRPRNNNQKLDIRWGSDTSFAAAQGFMAPSNQDTEAELERAHIQTIESALKLDLGEAGSTDNSHPTSPVQHFKPQLGNKSNSQVGDEADPDSRPTKRRKGKSHEEGDEDDIIPSSAQEAKKRRPTKKEPLESLAKDADASKRRKSSGTGGKSARENLTEDQKRENHIRSEQKRRTLIREGFEDLGELVPGLKGGGFSKSAVLVMAADWMEDLLRGNEMLRARLEQMEGRR